MPGTLGGLDLFKVTILGNNNYGKPQNLGPKINSSANETTPFIADNILYFSSNGYKGFGGFDIYKINLNSKAKVINLGETINSKKDDLAYTKKATKNYGFFSSNREGGKGNFDIYFFNILKKEDLLINNDTNLNNDITSLYKKNKTKIIKENRNKKTDVYLTQRKIDLGLIPRKDEIVKSNTTKNTVITVNNSSL